MSDSHTRTLYMCGSCVFVCFDNALECYKALMCVSVCVCIVVMCLCVFITLFYNAFKCSNALMCVSVCICIVVMCLCVFITFLCVCVSQYGLYIILYI
jgi:hypothetical protein